MWRRSVVIAAFLVINLSASHISAQATSPRAPAKPPVRDDEPLSLDKGAAPNLSGTWRSAPEEIKLAGDFDTSVWGQNATSVRLVELSLGASGDGTLKITRKVIDGRGKTIAGSASTEEAQIQVGAAEKGVANRLEHVVKVINAERRYPDDPSYKWTIDGLKVKVVSFEDDANALEVRFDTPEGRGSFWETLRRAGRSTTRRTSR